jgi:hypothetical protein
MCEPGPTPATPTTRSPNYVWQNITGGHAVAQLVEAL